ncbi:UDP-N-acetylglucosamine 2-epimerase (non-hydrolyzing) [Amycolatopsis sp. AA4]|uniref:non-hydrolyzing UDP-N-acetylglucosamine 2-epimerase n=1 Tax=Actinomycetes TaxID=1760 RepID=UPI0002DC37C8|nr:MULTISPECIES: UDP-N-acetylglucosamine 2-epimerase (non-hydrolyzing) [Actinomycetes]ATY13978.1 UDP-N-acetylglucosamine 2-epimerase (non-hydrolyzing) [Amycolatopsis sp. AA4]
MSRELVLFAGTRPEAIKLAPIALAAEEFGFRARLVATGQHPEMVDQGLAPFGLVPDERIQLSRVDGTLSELFARLVPEADRVLAARRPAAVVVQGDTGTTLAGALAAFWQHIPVVHLEAGLRTGDLSSPFPEEANRQLVSRIAALHLAPTPAAAAALRAEGVPDEKIVVTGNTVVDAAQCVARLDLPPKNSAVAAAFSGPGPLVLVTMHRRESWRSGIGEVLSAVKQIAQEFPDVRFVLPSHPNPKVRQIVHRILGTCDAVTVTEPLDYPDLIWVLSRSALVVTDSGGIQEEAPTFGVPVLVARETTERREAVDTGWARLVGTDFERVVTAARAVLNGQEKGPAIGNPFGAGDAAERSMAAIRDCLAPSGPVLAWTGPGAA